MKQYSTQIDMKKDSFEISRYGTLQLKCEDVENISDKNEVNCGEIEFLKKWTYLEEPPNNDDITEDIEGVAEKWIF